MARSSATTAVVRMVRLILMGTVLASIANADTGIESYRTFLDELLAEQGIGEQESENNFNVGRELRPRPKKKTPNVKNKNKNKVKHSRINRSADDPVVMDSDELFDCIKELIVKNGGFTLNGISYDANGRPIIRQEKITPRKGKRRQDRRLEDSMEDLFKDNFIDEDPFAMLYDIEINDANNAKDSDQTFDEMLRRLQTQADPTMQTFPGQTCSISSRRDANPEVSTNLAKNRMNFDRINNN